MSYPTTGEAVPGSFEHRSMDCTVHGGNVIFARPAGSKMPYGCVACLVAELRKKLESVKPVSHAMFIRLATNKALDKYIVFPDHKTGHILPCSKVGAAMDAFANIQLALIEDADCPDRLTNGYWYPDGK